jgi:hypothetical protein
MKPPKISLLIVSFAVTLMSSASSESIGEIIKSFGFDGAWSLDCAQEGERLIVATPVLDAPTITLVSSADGKKFIIKYELTSARMITDRRLKIESRVTEFEVDGKTRIPENLPGMNVVYEKYGSKIRIVASNPLLGLLAVPQFEKCLEDKPK